MEKTTYTTEKIVPQNVHVLQQGEKQSSRQMILKDFWIRFFPLWIDTIEDFHVRQQYEVDSIDIQAWISVTSVIEFEGAEEELS